MKSAVIVFPGSNRDRDAVRSLWEGGVEVATVWHAVISKHLCTDHGVYLSGFSYV